MAGETILVVDDSEVMQSFICQTALEPAGYRVLSAYDGNAGLEQALDCEPDLILLDLSMPGKSGLEVLEALREEGLTTPVIVMTSYGSEESILKSLRLGAKDFLQKPFTDEDVLGAVANALAEMRWQRERAHMAQALAQANQELQEQLKAWANLNFIGQAISSTLEEADVQRRLMWGINQLMRVEAGSLYLVDEETGELVLQISLKGKIEKKGGLRLKPGQGIAGWVARHNRPALVADAQGDERFYSQVDRKTGFVTRSVLTVPLTVKGQVLGVIQVINPLGSKEQFDRADQELLEALAASVAVAVENARLYARMRETITLETLRQTVTTLAHHINNALMSLGGNLQLIEEKLRQDETCPPDILEMVSMGQADVAEIVAVMRVLRRLAKVKSASYYGQAQMIDVDAALRDELKKLGLEG